MRTILFLLAIVVVAMFTPILNILCRPIAQVPQFCRLPSV